MKKFQNVQSKVRNELSEREKKDDLKPMHDMDDRNLIEDGPNQKVTKLPPIQRRGSGIRQSLQGLPGARGNSSNQRSSSRLLAAGGGIINSNSNKGLKTGAQRNSSYAGPRGAAPSSARGGQQPAALSKDMLTSLDNYNRIQDKGKKVDRVADSIEAASKHRQSKGELKPIPDQKKFQANKEMTDNANGKENEKEMDN